ncbi:metallo-beta-lactamase superfamily protein [Vibrio sp. ES.051]|uniref:MBL fold metallo-hydrolase n=1 Tax=Vibrio sp. ES.051 TaxID=1761909 RepID=UPI000C00A746|nr:MBL fold metallo-hydrolase [Vibrio sp. ES.051]PFG58530.1 metallo-beta-lactamase superfamily protein [Vibrio sp. ES.051]
MYLAEYPDKLMLLDGASRADIPHLKDFIEHQLNRPFTDLKMVVVTHMHPDHAGAAHKLRDLTGCKVLAAKRDEHWYCGIDGWLMHLTDLMLARWMANRMRKPTRNLWYSRKLQPDVELMDGEPIPGFNDWLVLETPGHTDRDLSIYHPEQDVLYIADLVVQVKKHLIAPFPIFHPNQYRNSIKRVFEMSPMCLLAAHGGEVKLDEAAYQHLLDTAPTRPITHWRVIKIKLKGLISSLRNKKESGAEVNK